MEILGGAASITQLAVYTNSAWKICTRLYVELKGGPASWQEHRTNLKHLIHIISRISTLSERAQLDTSDQIAELVHDLFELAEEALRTIGRANEKIFGVRWFLIGATELLDRTFESLKTKREILSLILQSETLTKQSYTVPRNRLCAEHTRVGTMDPQTAYQELVPSKQDSQVSPQNIRWSIPFKV